MRAADIGSQSHQRRGRNSRKEAVVQFSPLNIVVGLHQQPVMHEIADRLGAAERLKIVRRGKGEEMEPPEFDDAQIQRGGPRDLDCDVGFQTQHVRRFHRAMNVNEEIGVRALEFDQPWRDPEGAEPFSHREADFAGDVAGIALITRL